jgi:hypothetical protein
MQRCILSPGGAGAARVNPGALAPQTTIQAHFGADSADTDRPAQQ